MVARRQRVDELTNKISVLTSAITAAKKGLAVVAKPYAVDRFLELTLDEEIDEKIAEVQKVLEADKRAAEIRKLPLPEAVHLADFDLDSVGTVLACTVEEVSETAAGLVRAHIAANLRANGEQWLESGLRNLADCCPFCARPVEGLSLIDAFRGFFNEAYRSLVSEVSATTASIDQQWSAVNLAAVLERARSNDVVSGIWKPLVTVSQPTFPFDSVSDSWGALHDAALDAVRSKANNPLQKMAPSERLKDADSAYHLVRETVVAYNATIQESRGAIQTFLASLAQTSAQKLQEEMERLTAMQRRIAPEVQSQCDELKHLSADKEALSTEKADLRAQLDAEMKRDLQECEAQLNAFLDQMGTTFRIVSVGHNYIGGPPKADFKLEVSRNVVPLAAPSGSGGQASFGNTLSDGDKRALAFAFFLTRLENDPGLAERIVVIDDPVSSFDVARRDFTKRRLVRLASKCKQLIVLTHDPHFAWEFSKAMACKVIEIARRGTYSEFAECNILSLCRTVYSHHLHILEDYIDGASGSRTDPREAVKCIRLLIEGQVRLTHGRHLDHCKQFGEVLKAIGDAKPQEPLASLSPYLTTLSEINEYCIRHHHDANPQCEREPITDAEVRRYAQRAVDFVQRR